MLLTYLFDDFTTEMDISPDVIAFGSQRISVKNIASVSASRRLRIWNALDSARKPINAIVLILSIGVSAYVEEVRGERNVGLFVFFLLGVAYSLLVMWIFYAFNVRSRRDLVLVTAGGRHIVFNNISRGFARQLTRLLQDVIAGKETRRFRVNRRQRSITVVEPEA
jgi:hypothetical protein